MHGKYLKESRSRAERTWKEAEFKADGIIDLAEEILRQSSTQAVVF